MALLLLAGATAYAGEPGTRAVEELAGRILGDASQHFFFELTESSPHDHFTITDRDGRIAVSGNNVNSLATGLNYYLKNHAGTSVSWYASEPVYVPEVFPAVGDTVTVEALVPDRFFLNYCTFGYTMPYWGEKEWERLIDWMALNGVTMPLAITGQEAVWLDVWRKHGLADEDILAYFTGPAHLPWHRMCNIDAYQGPLPAEWLDNQRELQKFILERERSLGMKPVLPGFAGHVPAKLKEIYPEAKTSPVSKWGGFEPEYACTYLSPADSLFATIQRDFIEAQTRIYGTDHLYGIDCFNEVDPPSWEPDSLRSAGAGVFASLNDVDPESIWVQMAWMFYYDRKHWTPERVKAYLEGVPTGRMKFLDYYCDFTELWPDNDSFHGHDFIWSYLGNFGGNTFLAGDHKTVKSRIDNALKNAPSMTGIGSTLEGLDVNPYMYEMVFDQAWNQPLDENQRIASIARRRAGDSPEALEAWTILADSIYRSRIYNSQGTLLCSRPAFEGFGRWLTNNRYDYNNADLFKAWGKLLDAAKGAKGRDSYRYDIVNLGRQALGNHFVTLRDNFTEAYKKGDKKALKKAGKKMTELIDDCTALLACHPAFSLKTWIEPARTNISDKPELQDYFEQNARTIVTLWGSHSLTDYANRMLAELNDQYYGERWRRFIAAAEKSLAEGKEFDTDGFLNEMYEFEEQWTDPAQVSIKYLPEGDALSTARRIYAKWATR